MPIEAYLQSAGIETASYLNLNIPFSAETPAKVERFCAWLRRHSSVTHVSFRDVLRGGHRGVYLSELESGIVVQVFTAIRDNPKIQRVELPNCHLETITDIRALEAIASCLESKAEVIITKSAFNTIGLWRELFKQLPCKPGGSLMLDDNMLGKCELETARAICAILARGPLASLSLQNNKIGTSFYSEQLLSILFGSNIGFLNLSENSLGCGSDFEDWVGFITAISENSAIKKLHLRNCSLWALQEVLPKDLPEDKERKKEFEQLLLKFVRATKLNELDISLNNFSEDFIGALKFAAAGNTSLVLHCNNNLEEDSDVFCVDDDTPYVVTHPAAMESPRARAVALELPVATSEIIVMSPLLFSKQDGILGAEKRKKLPDADQTVVAAAHSPTRMASTVRT